MTSAEAPPAKTRRISRHRTPENPRRAEAFGSAVIVAILAVVLLIALTATRYLDQAEAVESIESEVQASTGVSQEFTEALADPEVKAFYEDTVFAGPEWSGYTAMAEAAAIRQRMNTLDSMTRRVQDISMPFLKGRAEEALHTSMVAKSSAASRDNFLVALAHTKAACASDNPSAYADNWVSSMEPAPTTFGTVTISGDATRSGSEPAAALAYPLAIRAGINHLCPQG